MYFIGINKYARTVWRHDKLNFLQAEEVFPEGKYTEMEREVYPDGLCEVLALVHETYGGPALYVTGPLAKAWTYADISYGPLWTTSSGGSDTANALASCAWISTPRGEQ